jgi:hypothetical protein
MQPDPDGLARATDVTLFQLGRIGLPAQQRAHPILLPRRVIGMGKAKVVEARRQEFVAPVADKAAERIVNVEKAVFRIDNRQGDRTTIQYVAEVLYAACDFIMPWRRGHTTP